MFYNKEISKEMYVRLKMERCREGKTNKNENKNRRKLYRAPL